MLQWYHRDEEAFVLFKSRCHALYQAKVVGLPFRRSVRGLRTFAQLGRKRQKETVKVYHAEKTLQLLDILRSGALFDCSGLLRRWGGTFRRNHVAKKFQRGESKKAFFQIDGLASGGKN